MSDPVLANFVEILKGIGKDQVIRISATNGELPGNFNFFKNLGVMSANFTTFQYPEDEKTTRVIEIIGPHHDCGGKIFRVICPCPTALTISKIGVNEEKSFEESLSGLLEGFQSIAEDVVMKFVKINIGEEESGSLKAGEPADQEEIQEYILDKPIPCVTPPCTFHQHEAMNCLQKVLWKNDGFFSPDDLIASITYRSHHGSQNFYDMLITEVHNFAAGFIIGFVDVEPKNSFKKRKLLEVLKGEAVSLGEYEKHYFFIRNLQMVRWHTVKDYALERLLYEEISDFTIPAQKKKSIVIGENHDANFEALRREVVKNPDFLTNSDKVVSIAYDGKTERGLLITGILKSGDATIVSFKDLKNYGGSDRREKALLEFLIQGEVATPPSECYICCFSLDEVAPQDPYDYAVGIILDKKVNNIRNHKTAFEEIIQKEPDLDLLSFDGLPAGEYLEDTCPVFVIETGGTVLCGVIITGLEVVEEKYLVRYRELEYEGVSDNKLAVMMVAGEKLPVPTGPTKKILRESITRIIRKDLKDYGAAKLLNEIF